MAAQGIEAASASTLEDVRGRDKLICGISEGLAGFSDKDEAGNWYGFDVDFCRAVAAAVLGDPQKVDYVQLSANDRFKALTDGKIDLLSRNSTWTMSRDLDLDLDFAGIAYYDGQGFLAHAVDGMTSALELNGARICVVSGTTTEENAAEYFADNGMDVTFLRFADRGQARKAYASGECDVYTADSSALAAERSLLDVPDDHVILSEVISKEPLGPVTREGDPQWTELVRWVLYGLINAEEAELTAASVDEKTGDPAKRHKAMQFGAPGVKEFGLSDDWLIVVLNAVGNYSDIFERNLGEQTPLALRRGVNALWTRGGILYAPPMH
ncbi:MAG: amino acid ABC transporter substrate-binding protein [Bauldia sp.]|uniref:amino acid ABC transporter substrate-binding protein n=1 Tax=Bauldia sp. TaxID=2575872 RepID=UPI001D9EA1F1|nr:amino acid ABC transporter substrate-binding protein [Bauldia sp.]MCB1494959.1 amino acid ABC transporter substrate-binding protein [Bauldia sp.]